MKIMVLALMMGVCAAAYAEGSAFIYDPHGVRDPFLPLVTQGGAIITYETEFVVSEMALEGIIADGSGSIAIINGNIVERGGKIGLYTVQGIEEGRVILLKDGEVSVLQLKKEE